MRRLPSKLTPTWPDSPVPRPRLFRSLDALAAQRITWISAPPGAGKTTLLGSYLAKRRRSVLWYHVDAGDGDPCNLFHYLPVAVASLTGAPLALTPPPALAPASRRALTRRFFEACLAPLPPGTCLVFDDYQEAAPFAEWNQAFRDLCAAAPVGIRVLVASRGRPPALLARLVAHGALGQLEGPALRFEPREVATVLRQAGSRARRAHDVAALHALTDGWAVAISLLARRPTAEAGDPGGVAHPRAGGQLDTLFAYLASEILERLDGPTRQLLEDVAVFPTFTAAMAIELSGRRDAARLLGRVQREQLLVEHDPSSGFRLHELFRSFLRERARQTRSSKARASLARRAARILARVEQFQEAAELLIATDQPQALAMLIVEHAPRLASEGRVSVLARGLAWLPEGLLARSPWLVHWKAVLRLGQPGVEAERLAARAFALFERAGDAAGAAQTAALAVQAIVFSREDFHELARWLERLENVGAAWPAPLTVGLEHAKVLAALHVEPGSARCREIAACALGLAQRHGSPTERVLVSGAAAMLQLLGGDCALALDTYRLARASTAPQPRDELPWMASLFFEAMLAFHAGDLDAVDERVRQGLRISRVIHSDAWTRELLGLAVSSALLRGDLVTAERDLERMGHAPFQATAADRGYYANLRARCAFEKHDLAEALRWNGESLRLAEQLGFRPGIGASLLCHAVTRASAGERRAVEGLWTKLDDFLGEDPAPYWTVATALARAYVSLCFEEDAAAALSAALGEMRRSGLKSVMFFGRRLIGRVVAAALERELETELVHELIRHYHLEPDGDALTSAAWPWPVKIRALGGLSIAVGDVPVRFGRKTPVVPLALLKLLLGHPQGLTPERLNRALWPGYRDKGPRGALNTALYRLRNLLGSENAIETTNGQVRLAARVCWTDTASLVAVCERIEAWTESDVDRVTLARTADVLLDLYRGPLASEDDPKEVLRASERLHARCARSSTIVEERLRRAGDEQRATSVASLVRARSSPAERNR